MIRCRIWNIVSGMKENTYFVSNTVHHRSSSIHSISKASLLWLARSHRPEHAPCFLISSDGVFATTAVLKVVTENFDFTMLQKTWRLVWRCSLCCSQDHLTETGQDQDFEVLRQGQEQEQGMASSTQQPLLYST